MTRPDSASGARSPAASPMEAMRRGEAAPSGTVALCCQEAARYSAFAVSLAKLELPVGWTLRMVAGCDLAWSRHRVIESLETDYVVFLDDDHLLTFDLIARLLRHGKEIVGPLNVDRHILLPEPFWRDPEHIASVGPPGLYEVEELGISGLLIHRAVFEAFGSGEPFFRAGVYDADGLVGEDVDFCRRARAHGFSLFVDSTLALGHITTCSLWPVYDGGRWQVETTIGITAVSGDRPGEVAGYANTFTLPERQES